MDYYCDKTIKNKSKTKHHKSKNHLHMKSYIRDEHIVGDVYWKDFYRVFRNYVDINRKKFPIFKTVVRCKLFNKDLVICYDKTKKKIDKVWFWWCGFSSFIPSMWRNSGSFTSLCFDKWERIISGYSYKKYVYNIFLVLLHYDSETSSSTT